MAITPMVKWAQREDKVFVTVEVTNSNDVKIDIAPEGKLTCSGKFGPDQAEFESTLEFHAGFDVEASKQLCNQNRLFFTLAKKEEGWWPRVTKEKVKLAWLKIDFDKWKDEDDDGEEDKPDNYDQAGMQGMGGGMPGMGGPPGAGGPGGMPPGMDMEAMMKMMGGMGGGAGGPGGGGMPDMASMMAGMGGGGMGGAPPAGDEDDAPDSDDDDMPELE